MGRWMDGWMEEMHMQRWDVYVRPCDMVAADTVNAGMPHVLQAATVRATSWQGKLSREQRRRDGPIARHRVGGRQTSSTGSHFAP
eukprot:332522-Chlamydomonas_euryale.AAC.1